MGCSRQERGEKAENAEDADEPADVEDRLPFRWDLSLCQGALSAEWRKVDRGDFGSAVQAHRTLADDLAAAVGAVGLDLLRGHLPVELPIPQVDLVDPPHKILVGVAVFLLQDRPQRFGQHEEFLHVALQQFALPADIGRGPGGVFTGVAGTPGYGVDGAGEKQILDHLCFFWFQ